MRGPAVFHSERSFDLFKRSLVLRVGEDLALIEPSGVTDEVGEESWFELFGFLAE